MQQEASSREDEDQVALKEMRELRSGDVDVADDPSTYCPTR
jgi:hypothetical protein